MIKPGGRNSNTPIFAMDENEHTLKSFFFSFFFLLLEPIFAVFDEW